MLLDPIPTSYGTTVAYTGGTPFNLRRIDKGSFISTDGPFSLDQPARWKVQPRVKILGPTTVKTRLEIDRNLTPVNGVVQQDDTAYCEINFGGNMRSFTHTDIKALIDMTAALSATYVQPLLRGES